MSQWILNRGVCPVKRGTRIDVEYADGRLNYGVSALTTPHDEDHIMGTNPALYAVAWGMCENLPILFWRVHDADEAMDDVCSDLAVVQMAMEAIHKAKGVEYV